MKALHRLIISILVSVLSIASSAAPPTQPTQPTDSVATLYPGSNAIQRLLKGADRQFYRLLRYVDAEQTPVRRSNPDLSVVGAPSYTTDIGLSLTILGSALYTVTPSDTLTSISNSTLYGTISTTGYWLLGIRGMHYGPRDEYRINYKVAFESFPTFFWGIGYDEDSRNSNKTKYLKLTFETRLALEWRLWGRFYIGPALTYCYNNARHVDDIALWHDQALATSSVGPGFNLTYDTRDFDANPYSGWYISLEQRFYPRQLGNDYTFSSSDIQVSNYSRLWRSGILASRLHTCLTYGHTPWGMLPFIGGSYTMRGYYEGRYRDKNVADITFELRQHIYRRSGIAVWAGAAWIFDEAKDLQMRKILPNFGVGYRWALKDRVNVRFDFGIGRGETSFVININEAF